RAGQELRHFNPRHGHPAGEFSKPPIHRSTAAPVWSAGMNFTFRRKRISGILTVLPANERSFVAEMKNFNFPEARSLKLMEVMGYNKRRLVEPGVCVSDLAVFGLQQLLNRGLLQRDDIDALLLVPPTADHFMPPTSNLIQGRLR